MAEDDEAAAERAALNSPPPAKGSTVTKPPPGVRTQGWFIDHEDARAYRRARYAEQKAEAQRTFDHGKN